MRALMPSALDVFQFTHPGRGATDERVPIFPPCAVSIHAPREGCDSGALALWMLSIGFNSRTPGGVRHISESCFTFADRFQFTHPGRGATRYRWSALSSKREFQFTHPGRGATR